MGKRRKFKFKFVVGDGPRCSAIWTVVADKNDVYISTSAATPCKVSLHGSGRHHLAIRSESLGKLAFSPIAGRYIGKWTSPPVLDHTYKMEFFVLAYESELRPHDGRIDESVQRLATPTVGTGTIIAFFIVAHVPDTLPAGVSTLLQHSLADGRTLILTQQSVTQNTSLYQKMLTHAAKAMAMAMTQEGRLTGLQILAQLKWGDKGTGLVEIATREFGIE